VRRASPSLEVFEAEEADFARVLAAAERFRRASEAELHDLEWIHEVVCSVGLSPLAPIEETYADMAHLVNGTHQGITQYPREFARWLHLLGQHEVRSYLEIGAFNGNTGCLATAYLQRLNPELRAVALDLFPSFLFYEKAGAMLPLEYRVGRTSYDYREEQFDAVFIDGDHNFDWAWADYQNVGRAARICGLHDIASEYYADTMVYGGIPAVWELIRQRDGGPGVEFHEFCDHPAEDRFGIGVRVRTSAP
jgi:hypothetical protein